jgi:ATP-binding cassette subfamily C (CFTR/MRP) protein 4
MHQIKRNAYLRAVNMACQIFLGRTAVFSCVLLYVLTGNSLAPEYVYVLSSFYEIIRLGSVIFLPLGMTMFGETITSVKRIQDFLTKPELTVDLNSPGFGITMDKICVKWDKSSPENTLTDVTLSIKPKQLAAVVGPVGSGKSTLLQVILKEIPLLQGSLQVGGSISYASQQPWLFGGSVRDNILFGEALDKHKYDEIVRACALEHDFAVLPFGDRTLVGERGVMLSGGQKARINLARAVYKDADLYLLDDPLSAVDAHVGKQLFDNCIKYYLRNKSTVLVTHQLQYLGGADVIHLMENGKLTTSGSYQELKESDNEFLKLLESQGSDETVDKAKDEVVVDEEVENEPVAVKESQGDGVVSNQVYRDYFQAGGTVVVSVVMILLHVMVQLSGNGTDYFLSFWVNLEQERNDTDVGTLSSDSCLYLYSGLVVFLIIIALTCSLLFFRFCMITSTNLHNKMFTKIVRAPMRFFNTNPSGRILNRFSRDIGLIDESLPLSLMDTIEIALNVVAITVIISIINPWILIPTVVMFALFYYYRIIFLASSRNLKRIEGISEYSQVFDNGTTPHFQLVAPSTPTLPARLRV